jgi:hypothetical protein
VQAAPSGGGGAVSVRKDQPAQLKRRIAVLEDQLDAERAMHDKMRDAWRDAVCDKAELKQRLDAALAALRGDQ